MEFTIYSIGDSEFLEQVLISVAMLMNSGAVQTAVMISALMGVILTAFSSITKYGKEFDLAPIFVGIILFLAFFVPKTTILIEDTVTGQIRVVDNVPLSVGVSGGMISQIGYGMSKLFEQGYSMTGTSLTNGYFAESLSVLSNLRKNAYNDHVFKGMEKDTNTDVKGDLERYVKECLAPSLVIKKVGSSDINTMNFFKLFELGNTSANSHGTVITDNLSGSRRNVTCSEAHNLLLNRLNSSVTSGTHTRKALGAAADSVGPALLQGSGFSTTGDQTFIAANNAMNSLNISSITAQQYMQAILLEDVMLEGLDSYYASAQEHTNRVMIRQAIDQRNSQWAAEQTLFMSTVRPLQAFFESLVYAISPFIAVLLVAGKIGYSLAGKYLLSLIWIQLWFPMLSIVNMFIHLGASRGYSQFNWENTELLSIYGLNTANQIAQTWVSTGGMLASSTPVIALFLVTGSVYTMNSIAGRMSGAAHVDPKLASPDLRSSPASFQASPLSSGNAVQGTVNTGAESLVPNFNVSSSLNNALSSSSNAQQSAMESFANTLSNGTSSASRSSWSNTAARDFSRALRTENSQAWEAASNVTSQIMKAYGIDEQHKEALTGVVAGQLAANVNGRVNPSSVVNSLLSLVSGSANEEPSSGPISTNNSGETVEGDKKQGGKAKSPVYLSVGASASVSGQNRSDSSIAKTISSSERESINDAISSAQSQSASLNQAIGNVISDNSQFASMFSNEHTSADQVSKSASQVSSSSKQYSEQASYSLAAGKSQVIEGATLANNMRLLDDGYMGAINQNLTSSEKNAINNRSAYYKSHVGLNSSTAGNLALAEHLYNNNAPEFNRMMQKMGHINSTLSSPSSNSYLQDQNQNLASGVSQNVNSGLGRNVDSSAQATYNRKENTNYGNNQVHAGWNSNSDNVARENHQNGQSMSSSQFNNQARRVTDNDPASLSSFAAGFDKSKQLIDQFTENPSYANAYAVFKGLTPSLPKEIQNSAGGKQISKGLEWLGDKGSNVLSAPVLNQLSEVLSNNAGNESNMIDYAKNNLGLDDTQAQYYAAKTANFSSLNAGEARNALVEQEKEKFMMANQNNTAYSPEQHAEMAKNYANQVVSYIDEASYYGDSASTITKPIAAANSSFEEYSMHTNSLNYLDAQGENRGDQDFFLSSNRSGQEMQVPSFAQNHPVPGARQSSEFNERRTRRDGSVYHHGGVDFAAPEGTAIYAPASGVVKRLGNQGDTGYGNWTLIDHGNGWGTLYAHMPDHHGLKEGQQVEAGQQIGRVGNTGTSTGPHLHFELVDINKVNSGQWGQSKYNPSPFLARVN